MSKLDYCNALLPGSSKFLLTKLHCILNMTCRIVCGLRKFDHVTWPMHDLHWLCFQERINYKIACIMFKCRDGTAPQYLMDLLLKGQSKQQLRSSSSNVCQIKFFKTSQGYNSSLFLIWPENLELTTIWATSCTKFWLIQEGAQDTFVWGFIWQESNSLVLFNFLHFSLNHC